MSRRNYANATHCWRGHELNGMRVCVVCRRKRDRDRKRRIAAAKRKPSPLSA